MVRITIPFCQFLKFGFNFSALLKKKNLGLKVAFYCVIRALISNPRATNFLHSRRNFKYLFALFTKYYYKSKEAANVLFIYIVQHDKSTFHTLSMYDSRKNFSHFTCYGRKQMRSHATQRRKYTAFSSPDT